MLVLRDARQRIDVATIAGGVRELIMVSLLRFLVLIFENLSRTDSVLEIVGAFSFIAT